MKKKLVVNSDLPKTQSTEPSLATSAPPIPPKTYLLKVISLLLFFIILLWWLVRIDCTSFIFKSKF